jgi:two-component system cell cycle sensor histidine kinase PleC
MAGDLPGSIRIGTPAERRLDQDHQLSTSTGTGGRPIGRQGVVRDITQRKALEHQAAELANLKESLTQMLVHDLKNPAVALGGYLELLAGQQGHDENTTKWLNGMQSSLFFLNEIIANILDVSRLEGGHVPLSWEHWRIADVVGEVLKDTTLMARAKDLRVSSFAGQRDRCPWRPADGSADLINLVSNAVKFSLSGRTSSSRRMSSEGRVLEGPP